MTTDAVSSPLPVKWSSPLELLSPERLDIAVKWRFFRHLMAGDDQDSVRVYRWHIERRTGGVEPRSRKRTLDHYVWEADSLLRSTLERGFDPSSPVVVGNNGRMMDGAHRTACAIAIGALLVPVHRRADKPGTAAPWGLDWFVNHGVERADLVRIQSDWEILTR